MAFQQGGPGNGGPGMGQGDHNGPQGTEYTLQGRSRLDETLDTARAEAALTDFQV
jgi:hypothetical protein